jgi:hypothetical protein
MSLGIHNLDESQARYTKLWVAVMVSGLRDASNYKDDKHKGMAWLLSDDRHVGSFYWICEEALHVDARSMLRMALKNMDTLKRAPKNLIGQT